MTIWILLAIQLISDHEFQTAAPMIGGTKHLFEVTMKSFIGKRRVWSLLFAAAIVALAFSAARAQDTQQPQPAETQQTAAQQDPITRLNLSAEQMQRIRTIREQNRDERAAINRRVRQAQIALDTTLDSENPSEELIAQRAHELGEAQAALIRMRAVTEVRIRRVLTLEQLARLRQLRVEAARAREEQRLENRPNPGNRRNGLPNQRNGVGPLNQQRRNLQRKPDF
jgi:Spy/CpxP family protein refolding chaperone